MPSSAGLGQFDHIQDLVSDFALLFENDTRVAAVGWFDLFDREFFQGLFTGSSLFGFGGIRGETGG